MGGNVDMYEAEYGGAFTSNVDEYKNGKWARFGNMWTGRMMHRSIMIEDMIYIIGGKPWVINNQKFVFFIFINSF